MHPESPHNPEHGRRGDDLAKEALARRDVATWVAKLEYAIQELQHSIVLQTLRDLHRDTTIPNDQRVRIANHPIEVETEGAAFKAPLLTAYLWRDRSAWHEIVRAMIALGADPNVTGPDSLAAIDVTIRRSGNPEILKTLVQCGGTSSLEGAQFSIDVGVDSTLGYIPRGSLKGKSPTRRETVDFRTLLDETARLYSEVPAENQRECREFIRRSGSLYHGYVYLRATEEATIVSRELEERTAAGLRFLELTQILFGGRHPREIETMVHQIEDLMDHHSQLHFWHQSEPELALMLGHPGMDYTNANDHDVGNTISRSLTGIYRLFFRNIQSLDPVARETIGKLGFLTHSFKFLRYDTEREKLWLGDGAAIVPGSSLIEQFGLERVDPRATDRHRDQPTRDHFGRGYVLRPHSDLLTKGWLARDPNLDPEFHIEFRRAYILANHPKLGTILIRNSSPIFGRDTLQHFAYWGPTPTDELNDALDLLYPERLIASRQLRPVLTAEGRDYKNVAIGLVQSQSVTRLVDGILAVKDGYRRWKFDTDATTAWESDPQTNARYPSGAGMHLSEGFPAVVKHLVERQRFIAAARTNGFEVRERLPDLAFFHPYLPAWHPEQFSFAPRPDSAEVTRTRLRVSREVLEGLQKLAARDLRASDLQRLKHTGLMEFLVAGAQAQAELVMIPPGTDDTVD